MAIRLLDTQAEDLFLRCGGQSLPCPSVGHLRQAIAAAMDRQLLLEGGIMRGQIGMANGPARPVAIPLGGFEILVGQPQGDSTPGEAAASDLMASRPEEGAIRRMVIRMILFVDIEGRVLLPIARMLGLLTVTASDDPLKATHHVGRLIALRLRGRQLGPGFQNKNADPCVGQCHGRNTAGGSRSHHDRLKRTLTHGAACSEEHCAGKPSGTSRQSDG